jgi:serine/threonine-protein kinase
VTVPDLVGTGRAQAEAELAAAGLRLELHLFTDWHMPAGTVISSQPAAGTAVPPGTTVQLFVSTGRP